MTEFLIRHVLGEERDKTADARVREKYGLLSGAVGLFCNFLLFAAKLLIGFTTGAISIAADAVNNLSDGLSSLISMIGFKVSGRAPDAQHPFGYGRTEYIAGLIVSLLICVVGVQFLQTSASRILHPEPVTFTVVSAVVLVLTMLVKLWMGAFNHCVGTRIDSPTLLAAMQDSINDVITTGVVLIGMVAGRFTTLPVDGVIGVLVALFIIWAGIGIARDTLSPLIGQAADREVVKAIGDTVLESPGILGIHDLIVHNYGVGKSLASLHAEVPDTADIVAVHELIDEAERAVWEKTGVYTVIHMDPVRVGDPRIDAMRETTLNVLAKINPELTMHDFRVVEGERRINLIFDVVVPFGYTDEQKEEIRARIHTGLKARDKRYCPVVTLEHKMTL
nr:cation diffusion facilitator family transporter [uncultured Butyricicoccus sp.]